VISNYDKEFNKVTKLNKSKWTSLIKHNGEGQDFYYMGDVTPIEDSFIEKEMPGDNGKPVKVVQLVFKISHEVEYSLLDYFIND